MEYGSNWKLLDNHIILPSFLFQLKKFDLGKIYIYGLIGQNLVKVTKNETTYKGVVPTMGAGLGFESQFFHDSKFTWSADVGFQNSKQVISEEYSSNIQGEWYLKEIEYKRSSLYFGINLNYYLGKI